MVLQAGNGSVSTMGLGVSTIVLSDYGREGIVGQASGFTF